MDSTMNFKGETLYNKNTSSQDEFWCRYIAFVAIFVE